MKILRHVPELSLAVGSLTAALLAGCASVPKVEVDAAAATQIKRVAVLRVAEPTNVQVANLGGAAGAFGLVGGLIQGTTNADHSKQFVEALRQRKTSLSEPMLAAVTQSFKGDGFEVTVARDQKPKLAADGKSDDYSEVHVDADAILSVWFGVVGYMSAPNSTHYEPWVLIKARLLDAKTKKDIYFKTFCVGYKMKIENVMPLPADPKYRYGSFDDLMAHTSDAAAGLVDCGEIVAKRIGADLKVQ
jgi:hypothetical protein